MLNCYGKKVKIVALIFVPIWAAETCFAAFAAANAVGCAFVFAVALKLAVFLEKHLHANGGKRYGDNNDGDEKERPKHNLTGDGLWVIGGG